MAESPDADATSAGLRISAELAQRFIPAQSDYGLSAMDQSIAGATAKAFTKLALYPLDTWKSRRQAASTLNLRGLWSVAGVYRGVVPKIALYTPYQAVYMATYTRARDILVAEGSPVYGSNLAFVCAGVSAEIAGSLVRLPMEVWKLRLQLGVYRSTRHALQDFFRSPWCRRRWFTIASSAQSRGWSSSLAGKRSLRTGVLQSSRRTRAWCWAPQQVR